MYATSEMDIRRERKNHLLHRLILSLPSFSTSKADAGTGGREGDNDARAVHGCFAVRCTLPVSLSCVSRAEQVSTGGGNGAARLQTTGPGPHPHTHSSISRRRGNNERKRRRKLRRNERWNPRENRLTDWSCDSSAFSPHLLLPLLPLLRKRQWRVKGSRWV